MTDNEIITALRCCDSYFDCDGCPCNDVCGGLTDLSVNTLDLLSRQKAEIERYKHSIKLLEKDVADAQTELKEFKEKFVDEVAKMRIKEFAERLKKDLFYKCGDMNYTETCDARKLIDKLLKEMD